MALAHWQLEMPLLGLSPTSQSPVAPLRLACRQPDLTQSQDRS